jgi:hypothetical protein
MKLTSIYLSLMVKLRMSGAMGYLDSSICLHGVYRDNFTFSCRCVTAVIGAAPISYLICSQKSTEVISFTTNRYWLIYKDRLNEELLNVQSPLPL